MKAKAAGKREREREEVEGGENERGQAIDWGGGGGTSKRDDQLLDRARLRILRR